MPRCSLLAAAAALLVSLRLEAAASDAQVKAEELSSEEKQLAGLKQPGQGQDPAKQAEYARRFAGAWVPRVENASDPESWQKAFKAKFAAQKPSEPAELADPAASEVAEAKATPLEATSRGPRSAADCKTLQELRQWRQAELEKVRAYVPQPSRGAASAGVEREFLKHAEKLHQEELQPQAASSSDDSEASGDGKLADVGADADTDASPADASQPEPAVDPVADADALDAASSAAVAGPDDDAAVGDDDQVAAAPEEKPVALAAAAPHSKGQRALRAVLIAAISLSTGLAVMVSPACRRGLGRSPATAPDGYIYLMEP